MTGKRNILITYILPFETQYTTVYQHILRGVEYSTVVCAWPVIYLLFKNQSFTRREGKTYVDKLRIFNKPPEKLLSLSYVFNVTRNSLP